MLYFAICKPIVGEREREERTSSQKMIPNETEASQRKASPAELHSPRRLSRSLWKGTDFVKFIARGNTAPKDFIIFTRCFSAPAPPPPQSTELSVSLQTPPQSLHLSIPNNNTRVPKLATHSSIHLPTHQSSSIHLPTSHHPSNISTHHPSSIQLPSIHPSTFSASIHSSIHLPTNPPSIHQLGLFPHRLWNVMEILSIIITTCGQYSNCISPVCRSYPEEQNSHQNFKDKKSTCDTIIFSLNFLMETNEPPFVSLDPFGLSMLNHI
jgi:hypothetical protein